MLNQDHSRELPDGEITQLLPGLSSEGQSAEDQAIVSLCEDLRRPAKYNLANERRDHTLQLPTNEHYNDAQAERTVRRQNGWRSSSLSAPAPTPCFDDFSQEQFDRLLCWLDPDRERAGIKYEYIRKRLMKIFVCRGSKTPEELADQTINRVARKLPEIEADYVGDPAHYFCGVASNVFRESLRRERVPPSRLPVPSIADKVDEEDYVCLEHCMDRLSYFERNLILAYYQQEKYAKIDNRKKLAERLGLGLNALRIRACRIRADLRACFEECRCEKKKL